MVYSLGRRLYVGLLDEANSCSLMASRGASFSLQSRLRPLPPGYLPEPTEVVKAVQEEFDKEGKYDSIVFAGIGEPTLRLGALLECAKMLKRVEHSNIGSVKLRLNTNGLGNVEHGRNIVPDLRHAGIEAVSVALNTMDPQQYMELMKPTTAGATQEHVCEFIRACVKEKMETEVTAVAREDVDLQAVQEFAAEAGASFRFRSYHPAEVKSNI